MKKPDHPYTQIDEGIKFIHVETISPQQQQANDERLRWLSHIIYGLYAFFWATGGFSVLVGAIIAYVKRSDAEHTIYASHFRWQIRTFWLIFVSAAISMVLVLLIIGKLLLILVTVWLIYRIIKGWLALIDKKPIIF